MVEFHQDHKDRWHNSKAKSWKLWKLKELLQLVILTTSKTMILLLLNLVNWIKIKWLKWISIKISPICMAVRLPIVNNIMVNIYMVTHPTVFSRNRSNRIIKGHMWAITVLLNLNNQYHILTHLQVDLLQISRDQEVNH